MEPRTDHEAAATRYEDAETAFLAAVRADGDRTTLTALADAVAAKAKAWNEAAYAVYHASSGDERDSLDQVTERTEVLANLWFDIAEAFHGREALHDG
ncbi:hypothetical protein [Nocardioides dilutus]